MIPNDNKDNDCDGQVDEEICDDNIDNDGDGQMDEDCGQTLQPSTETNTEMPPVSICFGTTQTLTCSNSSRPYIKVISAHFGRAGYLGESSCGSGNPLSCSGDVPECGWTSVRPQVGQVCDGRSSCELKVDSTFVAACPLDRTCSLCSQYLDVVYVCTPSPDQCQQLASDQSLSFSEGYYSDSNNEPWNGCLDPNQADQWDDALEDAVGGCVAQPEPRPHSDQCAPSAASMLQSGSALWCPQLCYLRKPYLELDMKGIYRVQGVVLRGRLNWHHWVSSLFFSYSLDGRFWQDKKDQLGRVAQYQANRNAVDAVHIDFGQSAFQARFLRLNVIDWHGYPAMRVEVLRCGPADSCPPVSVPNSDTDQEPGQPGQQLLVRCRRRWMTSLGETEYRLLCLGSRQWSTEPRPCHELRQCSDIPSVPNALHDARSVLVGAQVRYYCQNGLQLSGNQTIQCQADRNWSQPPVCR